MRLACYAWIAVVDLGVLASLEFLIYPWVYERVSRGGEVAVSSTTWLAIDFLSTVWVLAPYLGCLGLTMSTWATLRVVVRRHQLLTSNAMRCLVIGGAAISSLGAAHFAMFTLQSAHILLSCETNTFEEAVSPNGRYTATVAEVDCGAATASNRRILLTRSKLRWASMPILYFRGRPSLHLSWSGRTLTISGDRTLANMARRPPDPMIWGGMLARYAGPKE
jgi:hypothetical protein